MPITARRGIQAIAGNLTYALAQMGILFIFGLFGSALGLTGQAAEGESVPGDILGDREALELVRSYYAIPESQRRRLFDLARVLSDVH